MAKPRRNTASSTGLHATSWTQRITLGLASLAVVGMVFGFIITLITPSVQAAPASPTAVAAATPTAGQPFAVGQSFNFRETVLSLQGQPTTLVRGARGTVVLLMASWCLYCGYEDRWVMPILAEHPGIAIDIIDISPDGGIANPGLESPAFTGHDGSRQPITIAGMEQTMQQYSRIYHLSRQANIHVYVAPVATQKAWAVATFPTMAFVNEAGQIAVAPQGAQTLAEAQQDWTHTVHG